MQFAVSNQWITAANQRLDCCFWSPLSVSFWFVVPVVFFHGFGRPELMICPFPSLLEGFLSDIVSALRRTCGGWWTIQISNIPAQVELWILS
ncbi:hypothetical protein U1Q18_032295 [Sarracenia purpurea var. burkii]